VRSAPRPIERAGGGSGPVVRVGAQRLMASKAGRWSKASLEPRPARHDRNRTRRAGEPQGSPMASRAAGARRHPATSSPFRPKRMLTHPAARFTSACRMKKGLIRPGPCLQQAADRLLDGGDSPTPDPMRQPTGGRWPGRRPSPGSSSAIPRRRPHTAGTDRAGGFPSCPASPSGLKSLTCAAMRVWEALRVEAGDGTDALFPARRASSSSRRPVPNGAPARAR